MSGRPDVQRLDRKDLPEDAPSWAEMFIEAHNKSVDAILDLASAPTNALKVLNFATDVDPATAFPKFVALPYTPVGLKVVKARNLTDPTSLFVDCTVSDWLAQPNGISIRYIAGLNASTQYEITIEAIRG